jgi:valyl-tRNA synthetase
MNFDERPDFEKVAPEGFTIADKWILSRMNTLTAEVTENLEKFELGIALQKIYEFIWEEFCDWYIELVKPRLYDRESPTRLEALYVLNLVLGNSMKLLHPFMPFITEEIYTHLVNNDKSIIISEWPVCSDKYIFTEDESKMGLIMEAIRTIRNIRASMNVPPSKKAKVIFVAQDEKVLATLRDGKSFLERLASASKTILAKDREGIPSNAVSAGLAGVEIFIPLEELVDIEKEIERLTKEKENLEKELARVDGKLNNKGFTDKAPEKVVAEEREKQAKYRTMYDKVVERLQGLGK